MFQSNEDEDHSEVASKAPGSIPPVDPNAGEGGGQGDTSSEVATKTLGIIGGPEDDLTLRASLYGVLFQCFADKVSCMGLCQGIYLNNGAPHGVLSGQGHKWFFASSIPPSRILETYCILDKCYKLLPKIYGFIFFCKSQSPWGIKLLNIISFVSMEEFSCMAFSQSYFVEWCLCLYFTCAYVLLHLSLIDLISAICKLYHDNSRYIKNKCVLPWQFMPPVVLLSSFPGYTPCPLQAFHVCPISGECPTLLCFRVNGRRVCEPWIWPSGTCHAPITGCE